MESPDFPQNIIICTDRTCPDPRLMAPTITSRLELFKPSNGALKILFQKRLVYTDTDMMRIPSNDGGQRLNAKLEDNVHMSRVSSRFSGLTVDINL